MNFIRWFNGVSAKNFRFTARGGIATRIEQTKYQWQLDNLLKWKKSFGEHQVNVTFLVNAEKFQSSWSQMDNEGFAPNDNLSYHNIGAGIKPTLYASDTVSTGDALMGRLNYSFKQRYMLTALFVAMDTLLLVPGIHVQTFQRLLLAGYSRTKNS